VAGIEPPRGGLVEIVGPASSGRTSLLLSILAAATARQVYTINTRAQHGLN
jgi:RecA/RadA recombinase